jgi:5S rRNA maturation endonuclease (ribonuclease M5)
VTHSNHDPITEVLSRLDNVRSAGDNKWTARCPSHEDRKNSLSVAVGDDERILLNCFAGCHVDEITDALDLNIKDLFPSDNGGVPKSIAKPFKPKKVYPTFADLIKVLEFGSHGKFSGEWVYADVDGCEVFRVLRFETDDGKTIRPAYPVDSGFVIGDPPGPLPLYNLPKLAEANRVYVVEGEKCCDAADTIGLTATTSAHGSKSASKSDWSLLAGKEVVICPDHDEPGERYAAEVASILTGLTPAANVKILRLPDMAKGEDIYDFIERRQGTSPDAIRAEVEALTEQAQIWTPAEPADAVTPREYQPFPAEAFPCFVRDFIEQGSEALNCDPAFIALPLLAAFAGAIGNSRRIILRRDWIEPCVLWAASVGDSGTLKSPAMDLALSALRNRHDEAMRDFQADMEAYKEAMLEFDRDLQNWKKSKDNSPPPQLENEPVPTRYTCGDVTAEALALMLQNQPRGILLERDELTGWLRSFGAYKSGKGGDEAHWLSIYGARSITVDRKSSGPKIIYVPRAAVSICGGIQPGILKQSLTGEHVENGLAARILMAMPPRRKRAWTEAEVDPMVKASVDLVFRKLLEFDFVGEGQPSNIPLSREAKEVWIDFYEDHANASFNLTNPALKAAFAKLEGAAARLTLVIHCVRIAAMEPGIQPDQVDETSVEMGVMLARWFRNEITRIYDILGIGQNGSDEEKSSLVELIRNRGGKVTVRELMQSCRKYRQDSTFAKAALDELLKVNKGRWVYPPPTTHGGRPSCHFELFT